MVVVAAIGLTLLLRFVRLRREEIGVRVVGRVLSYVVLILIALVGIAPFVYLAILSTKTRLDILEVPPSLDFDWETIKANYDVVINDDNFLTLIKNSIIVTGVSTLIALLIGVPAAYAFSRLRFRGREQWSTTILASASCRPSRSRSRST